MKPMKVIFDFDEALAMYNRYNVRFYVDGLREAGEDNFYDSEGTLVWSPTMSYDNFLINDPNGHQTGLTSKWGNTGDTHSQPEYDTEPRICLCIH